MPITARYDEKTNVVMLENIRWRGERKLRVLLVPAGDSAGLDALTRGAQATGTPHGGDSLLVQVREEQNRRMMSVCVLFVDERDQPLRDVEVVGDVYCGFYRAQYRFARRAIADGLEHVVLSVHPYSMIEPGALCYELGGVKYPVPIEVPSGKWTSLPGFDAPADAAINLVMRDGLRPIVNYVFEEKVSFRG